MNATIPLDNTPSNPNVNILNCKLCEKIPFFPEICSECREMYCQVCITAYLKSNNNICPNPHCKRPYVKDLPQSLIISLLESLILECKFQDRGCPEMIAYRQYLDHERDCKYRDIKCENCGTVLQSRQMKDHMDTCNKVVITKCGECGQPKQTKGHTDTSDKPVIKCKECGVFFQPKKTKDPMDTCDNPITKCKECGLFLQPRKPTDTCDNPITKCKECGLFLQPRKPSDTCDNPVTKCKECGLFLQPRKPSDTCDNPETRCKECGFLLQPRQPIQPVIRCRTCDLPLSPDSFSNSPYFKFLEKIITQKVIDCMAPQMNKNINENDKEKEKELADVYSKLDDLKKEVARLDNDSKDVKNALNTMKNTAGKSKPASDSKIPAADLLKERKEPSKSLPGKDKIGVNKRDVDPMKIDKASPNDFGSRKPEVSVEGKPQKVEMIEKSEDPEKVDKSGKFVGDKLGGDGKLEDEDTCEICLKLGPGDKSIGEDKIVGVGEKPGDEKSEGDGEGEAFDNVPRFGGSEKPGRREKVPKFEGIEKSGEEEKFVRAGGKSVGEDRVEKVDKYEGSNKSGGDERLGRVDRIERVERFERVEYIGDRYGKGENSSGGERIERVGGVDRYEKIIEKNMGTNTIERIERIEKSDGKPNKDEKIEFSEEFQQNEVDTGLPPLRDRLL